MTKISPIERDEGQTNHEEADKFEVDKGLKNGDYPGNTKGYSDSRCSVSVLRDEIGPPISIFKLPPEIRGLIYEYLLTLKPSEPVNDVQLSRLGAWISRLPRGCYPQILATCREIRQEAQHLLYACNTMSIVITHDQYQYCPTQKYRLNVSYSTMLSIAEGNPAQFLVYGFTKFNILCATIPETQIPVVTNPIYTAAITTAAITLVMTVEIYGLAWVTSWLCDWLIGSGTCFRSLEICLNIAKEDHDLVTSNISRAIVDPLFCHQNPPHPTLWHISEAPDQKALAIISFWSTVENGFDAVSNGKWILTPFRKIRGLEKVVITVQRSKWRTFLTPLISSAGNRFAHERRRGSAIRTRFRLPLP